ncbi:MULTISPECIES: type I CRISPR-associated protein Cas7 [unclassified Clostridioides]|uniref:type I CRISPR-associated protein Cas7 n=1 Tax=unclassified Clostridioides TaxID=2635829 RepID=UPI001D1200CE
MKNRVFGMIGIGLNNANINADMTGNPVRHGEEFTASPFSIKYLFRNYWNTKGIDVFYMRSYVVDKKNKGLVPRSLEKRLEQKVENINKLSEIEIQRELFKYIDVSCFGGVFAVKGFNRNYYGTIQFGTGVNKYEDSEVVRERMLSPFQNPKGKINKETNEEIENRQTTLGSRAYLTEGHYFYDFIINPLVNKEMMELDPELECFNENNYNLFKEASLNCANSLNSVSKKGCYNEFAIFIKLKEDSVAYLGNISNKVSFYKDEKRNVIDITLLAQDLLSIDEDIEDIEIYYNPTDTILKFPIDSLKSRTSINNILSTIKIDFMEKN